MCGRLWRKKSDTHVLHTGYLYHTTHSIALCCCVFHFVIFIPHRTNHSSHFFFKTMPFALETNGGVTIGLSSFAHCVATCDRGFPAEDSDSSSDSSIGRNSVSSENSSDREDAGEVEVQSSFKGPLDTMNDLEEDLPIK